jgi:hypothetical protein
MGGAAQADRDGEGHGDADAAVRPWPTAAPPRRHRRDGRGAVSITSGWFQSFCETAEARSPERRDWLLTDAGKVQAEDLAGLHVGDDGAGIAPRVAIVGGAAQAQRDDEAGCKALHVIFAEIKALHQVLVGIRVCDASPGSPA